MMNSLLFTRIAKFLIFMMALTGAAQMPIFKRFYIADLPGLGWLADFYLINKLHYIFGAIILFMAFYLFTEFILTGKNKFELSTSGLVRAVLYGLVLGSGVLRVVKSLPLVAFDPVTVMLIDWGHLGLAMLLGIVAMVVFFSGRQPYLAERNVYERKRF